MRQMKDSGIEWIGEIPAEWEIRRWKILIKSRDSGAWGDEAQGNSNDVICLRIADFDFSKLSFQDKEEYTVRNYDTDTICSLKLNKGDLLVEKSGGGEKTPVGRTVTFDKDIIALFANFMDRLVCGDNVCPRWMNYVFHTFYTNDYTKNYIKQTTGIQNLDLTSMLAYEFIPLPSLPEQQRIAAYLDAKCGEIDKVMSKTRESIAEYKKLKQSIITEAVTKGVDGERPMKDSGIEWIGEIPAEWEVRRIKTLGEYRNGLTYSPDEMVEEHDGILVLRSSNIQNGKMVYIDNVYVRKDIPEELLARKGDIVICSRNGSRKLIGKNAIVEDDINASFGAFMMIFRTKYTKYLYYVLNSEVFEYYLGTFLTSTINQLIGSNFGSMNIVFCPDVLEQQRIVAYLDKKCSEIDNLIARKEQLLTELEKYKKSLIYECVTGKREVG